MPEDGTTARSEPITEDWLRSVGFRWDEWERSGGKHWALWFGALEDIGFSSCEDVGIEVASFGRDDYWNCWLRSDFSHKYSRFIHIRHIRAQAELIDIIEALSGVPWKPANHLYGAIRSEAHAESLRQSERRLDRLIMKGSKWAEHEKDDSAAKPGTLET